MNEKSGCARGGIAATRIRDPSHVRRVKSTSRCRHR
jgi:hypothetical protein